MAGTGSLTLEADGYQHIASLASLQPQVATDATFADNTGSVRTVCNADGQAIMSVTGDPQDGSTSLPLQMSVNVGSGSNVAFKLFKWSPVANAWNDVTPAPPAVTPTKAAASVTETGTFTVTDAGIYRIQATLANGNGAIILHSFPATRTEQAPTYNVAVASLANGRITATPATDVAAGTTVALAIHPNANYRLKDGSLKVTHTSGGTAVAVSNNSFVMPAADVTVTAEFVANPSPPQPTTTYTVTLPETAGVSSNPAAGTYSVNEGGYFSFTLTLEDGYEGPGLVVTANGAALTPDNTGKYTVRNITEDITIGITGLIPTGIEQPYAAPAIRAEGRTLHIHIPQPMKAYVVTLAGNVVRSLTLPAGDSRIEGLAAGIYIVRLSDKTTAKVIIRR